MRTSPVTTAFDATETKLSPHLASLEAEAMEILREVAGQFERPALLFSGGKDSV
ncbi:MAG: sulfate adenylyltransferase small subunit, partial [Corynebacterium sp.]|nr:sulfate adenylyltransferase small subunit [Corynebacterium sp.]